MNENMEDPNPEEAPNTLGDVDVEDAPKENAVGVDDFGGCQLELLDLVSDVATAEPRPKLGVELKADPDAFVLGLTPKDA